MSFVIPEKNMYNAIVFEPITDKREIEKHKFWHNKLEKTFIETGTHEGHGVINAMRYGCVDIHSVEINKVFFLRACRKLDGIVDYNRNTQEGVEVEIFSRDDFYSVVYRTIDFVQRITLYKGDTKDLLPVILNRVEEKSSIWLDAHWGPDASNGLSKNDSSYKLFPVLQELDSIQEHSIKDHTIMIDDINQYKNTHLGDIAMLENKIRSINDLYQIKYIEKPMDSSDTILIAEAS